MCCKAMGIATSIDYAIATLQLHFNLQINCPKNLKAESQKYRKAFHRRLDRRKNEKAAIIFFERCFILQ